MEIIRYVVSSICIPIKMLVVWVLGIGEAEAQMRSELDLLRHEKSELNQRITSLAKSKDLLERKFEKIQLQLCMELDGHGSYVDGSATPSLLESTVKTLDLRISRLLKLFVDHLRIHYLDCKPPLRAHFEGIYLTRPAHVNYMLKAWAYDAFFKDFENESFLRGGPTLFLEQNHRKIKSFEHFERIRSTDSPYENVIIDSLFESFCLRKLRDFLSLWQSSCRTPSCRSILFNANKELRLVEIQALEPNFMNGFVSGARIVWALHKLCLSFDPPANILRIERGTEFQQEYMETVVAKEDDLKFVSRVGFLISPGFRLRRSVVKCQIYLEAGHI